METRTNLPENRLFALLPQLERNRLQKLTEEVTLELGDGVCRGGGPIDYVYFPRGGIMSLVVDMKDGGTVEVGTVGREGFIGLPLLHGSDRSPTRVYCQLAPCPLRRMGAAAFRDEVRRGGPFCSAAQLYAQA